VGFGFGFFGCKDAAISSVYRLRGPHTDSYSTTLVSRISRRKCVDGPGTHRGMGPCQITNADSWDHETDYWSWYFSSTRKNRYTKKVPAKIHTKDFHLQLDERGSHDTRAGFIVFGF
jgi:hypothetical protein